MRIRRSVFALACLIALGSETGASGAPVKTFPFAVSRLLVDSAHGYLYASLTEENSVAVVDLKSLEVVQTVTVGSRPMGMALSPGASKLYVALSGATQLAAIDPATLKTLPMVPIEQQASEVEAVSTIGCISVPNFSRWTLPPAPLSLHLLSVTVPLTARLISKSVPTAAFFLLETAGSHLPAFTSLTFRPPKPFCFKRGLSLVMAAMARTSPSVIMVSFCAIQTRAVRYSSSRPRISTHQRDLPAGRLSGATRV